MENKLSKSQKRNLRRNRNKFKKISFPRNDSMEEFLKNQQQDVDKLIEENETFDGDFEKNWDITVELTNLETNKKQKFNFRDSDISLMDVKFEACKTGFLDDSPSQWIISDSHSNDRRTSSNIIHNNDSFCARKLTGIWHYYILFY